MSVALPIVTASVAPRRSGARGAGGVGGAGGAGRAGGVAR
jgi:hypothetical protein